MNFSVKGSPSNKEIAPLILINFIENAFKYGVSSNQESTISINITIEERKIILNVYNTIVKKYISKVSSTKEGIANTQKRLEMVYPNKHS
ncbi:hypothetical protein NBRC110019_14940 [Neptunitalea chrysea]|uniref:Uncharacterized protein n=1 Tax=Neptunitalea chrysea TaxID=1647581 RepID=A0A9W6B735_9FLAO|nr:hypothetical protein [Neptunitalea chrysea]GLB52454.1 hypothetical protein NBRC110019_14940 [Neptunitalea chrysea]